MPRHSVAISQETLLQKLKEYTSRFSDFMEDYEMEDESIDYILQYAFNCGVDYGMFAQVQKDWGKIKFSQENLFTSPYGYSVELDSMLGPQTLSNGFTFLGVVVGGDWEIPLYAIVYYDGQTFRGYIPTSGNLFNKNRKAAFGNDTSEDARALQQHFQHLPEIAGKSPSEIEDFINQGTYHSALNYDFDQIKADLSKRIVVHDA